MTKAALKNVTTEIARKRREVARMQGNLAATLDHLTVVEARAKSANGMRYSLAKVKRVIGI